MENEPLCRYSVVRYVPDPIRNEPRNIGVVVVSEGEGNAQARFSLNRTHMDPASQRFRFLRSALQAYDFVLPKGAGSEFDASAEFDPESDWLQQVHLAATNILQFSEPLPSWGAPAQVLEDLYKDFVAPRAGRRSTSWTKGTSLQTFRRAFQLRQLASWVIPSPEVGARSQPPSIFDVGIRNGTWKAIIENASFRNQDAQRPEELAAWMTFVYPAIRDETGARGLLFVEQAPGTELAARFSRLAEWAGRSGIEVHGAAEAPSVASNLASELAHSHLRR